MTVKYGKFELPTKIKVDETSKDGKFARFIAEPFERGFGHTVGNALRRVMLTALEAPAIMSVRIEGVPHEYMAIEGIIEDMTHIVLNLKKSLLRKLPSDEEPYSRGQKLISTLLDITGEKLDRHNGQYPVKLVELIGDSDFDLVNPEHVIFHVTKPMTKRVELKIAIGRGYVPSERHATEKNVDEILIDSIFSPVTMVNYFVKNTRVGQHTDFDQLVLEVMTDGRISPEEALTFAAQIGILHFEIFKELKYHQIAFDKGEIESDTDRDTLMSKLSLKINEIELSVRSTNCLSGASIETIGELVLMSENEMLKYRNFGKKSLNEIKAKLEEMGLYLGMDLTRMGITRDNVKDMIVRYLAERAGSGAEL